MGRSALTSRSPMRPELALASRRSPPVANGRSGRRPLGKRAAPSSSPRGSIADQLYAGRVSAARRGGGRARAAAGSPDQGWARRVGWPGTIDLPGAGILVRIRAHRPLSGVTVFVGCWVLGREAVWRRVELAERGLPGPGGLSRKHPRSQSPADTRPRPSTSTTVASSPQPCWSGPRRSPRASRAALILP
jgi:hypothetical protein